MTLKVIWITDPHALPDGETLLGHDGAKRLQVAVEYINNHHSDADYCVLSGDLSEHGDVASYERVRKILSHCVVTTLYMPGNHDKRAVMRSLLSFPDNTHSEFIQYSVVKNGVRLICLDTLQENNAEGILCQERLNWLDSELSLHKDLSTLVFAHHPPGKLYLPAQDQQQHRYGDLLLDRLCAAPNVQHLFFGHVHRPVSGTFRGLGFTALQSIAFQAPLPYPNWDWDNFEPAEEAPAIGIIHATSDSVVVHFHAVCKPLEFVSPA